MSKQNKDFEILKNVVAGNAALDLHKIRSHLDAQKQKEDDARYDGYLKEVEMEDYVEFCERAHRNFSKHKKLYSDFVKLSWTVAFFGFLLGTTYNGWVIGILVSALTGISVFGFGVGKAAAYVLFRSVWSGSEKDLESDQFSKAVMLVIKKAATDQSFGWYLIKMHMERTEKNRQGQETVQASIISAQIEGIRNSKKKAS